MKRQIRYGMFETNSSSCHSILITKEDKLITKDNYEEEGEYFSIWNGKYSPFFCDDTYFGRSPFEVLSSVKDKVRYALASFCGDYSGKTDEEKVEYANRILDCLNHINPKIEELELPLEEIIIYQDLDGKELTEEQVFENYNVSEDSAMRFFYKKDGLIHPAKPSGYVYDRPHIEGVDHQSMYLLESFLKQTGISLEEFITNKRYIVIIDGDEYCYFSELKRIGLIDLDNIVAEYKGGDDWYGEYTELYISSRQEDGSKKLENIKVEFDKEKNNE